MRQQMVDKQIIARGISDRAVIRAMRNVERHLFVPEQLQSMAYNDQPLPIGFRQTISQPYIVAFMTEQLQLKSDSKVLEIGTGSGYQAAILGEICDSVFTIEIVKPLGQQAKHLLSELDYNNVHVKIGDGYHGWKEHASYDAIIVTAAPEKVPLALIEQLALNGRLVIPVEKGKQQYLMLYRKTRKGIVSHSLLPVRFVPFTREIE